MRAIPLAVLAVASLLTSACASTPVAPAPYWMTAAPELSISAQRGREFAIRRCGGCHNVGLDDGPPYEGPSFRRLGMRYTAIALERRFAEVAEHGMDMMPPVSFSPAEASDLIDYINTLPAP